MNTQEPYRAEQDRLTKQHAGEEDWFLWGSYLAERAGPDGVSWAPNSQVTIDRKGRDFPLTDTGTLGDSIVSDVEDGNSVVISSSIEYAAMQQFGGNKSDFPNLWGNIPARPFMGFSDQDEDDVLRILRDFLGD